MKQIFYYNSIFRIEQFQRSDGSVLYNIVEYCNSETGSDEIGKSEWPEIAIFKEAKDAIDYIKIKMKD